MFIIQAAGVSLSSHHGNSLVPRPLLSKCFQFAGVEKNRCGPKV